jgi:hypothetical protein
MADSPLAHAARLTGTVGGAALRPVAGAARLGIRLERSARTAVVARVNEAVLAGLDGMLASRLAQRAVSGALEGPTVEVVTREVIRHKVLERVAGELVASQALGNLTDAVVAGPALDTVTDRVLASGVVEQAAARVLDGPELERVVTSALDSPAMERLVAQAVESKLLDQAVALLLESDELWLLVDEIARSPAVTDAIAQQGVGFADQVAGGMRTRSRNADTWIEAKVQRALRRPPSP